ncbi:uncharacterized protein [Nicotiana tomentosiformis]|uniref:uncharacterized protein n=1 Tax=Nicotiana tomentosiformis TaxID=4098 RepID=UPI00388CD659
MAEDSELWDVVCDGPFVPMKITGEIVVAVSKTRKEYNDTDRKAIEQNFRAKKIIVCGIGPDEYNRISACQSAKEIWEALQTVHEGRAQVKESNIDMLTTEYKLFRMKDDESIHDMHTRFTYIINELHSLGEIIPRNKLVKKILSVLPGSWESKVNAITEAKDLLKLTIDELIGNLKTYEMKKKKDRERREPTKENNLVLKADNNDSSGDDADMAYLTRRFQKMPSHFIKDCHLHKQDQYKHNTEKTVKRNPVPEKKFKRKDVTDNVVKQALAAWGDSSSGYKQDNEQGDTYMMSIESEAAEYDFIFALMATSYEDEDDDDDEVNFLDVQRNLKSCSQKKLVSFANVLIDTYHNLINDKNIVTVELGEVDHERDDLLVVVVDLKETIEYLKSEKDALTEKTEKVEHERDNLLVVVVHLKEKIEELKRENSSGNASKGKEVASEAHLKLEHELKMGAVKGSRQR